MTEEDYKLMELIVIERKPHKNGPQWKFAGSFYYALVVLTLIGYGHSTPNTAFGKAFTMGYAAFGIPAAMVSPTIPSQFQENPSLDHLYFR